MHTPWSCGIFLSQGALFALAHLFPCTASPKQIKISRTAAHGVCGTVASTSSMPSPPCDLLAALAQGDGAGTGAGCALSCCPTSRLLCRGGGCQDGLVTARLKPGLHVGQQAQAPCAHRPVLLYPVLFISLQKRVSK